MPYREGARSRKLYLNVFAKLFRSRSRLSGFAALSMSSLEIPSRRRTLVCLFVLAVLTAIFVLPFQLSSSASKGLFQTTESHDADLANYDIRTDRNAVSRIAAFRTSQGKSASQVADSPASSLRRMHTTPAAGTPMSRCGCAARRCSPCWIANWHWRTNPAGTAPGSRRPWHRQRPSRTPPRPRTCRCSRRVKSAPPSCATLR